MVASFGNCWLEAIEESKRLKREKGTHKKVRDNNNETASHSHTFMFMPQTQHVTIAFLPSAFGSLTFLCVPFSLLSLLHSSTACSQQIPACDHASLHTSAEPRRLSRSSAAHSKVFLGRAFERGPGSHSGSVRHVFSVECKFCARHRTMPRQCLIVYQARSHGGGGGGAGQSQRGRPQRGQVTPLFGQICGGSLLGSQVAVWQNTSKSSSTHPTFCS